LAEQILRLELRIAVGTSHFLEGLAIALMVAGRVGSGGPLHLCRFFFPLCSLRSLVLEERIIVGFQAELSGFSTEK
jgi:hypothetical protein